MKPMHASNTRLSRCPCCQSGKGKLRCASRKNGKSSARQQARREMKKEMV